jgi:regulator of sigma D
MKREYNPSLINQLKNDHKKLFDIYNKLYDMFISNSNHKEINNKLHQLEVMLNIHINFEDTLLYAYLNNRYENDSDKLNFITNTDKEMKSISLVALNFINKCSNPKLYNKHKDKFKEELKIIGDILVKRVEFEENKLYPLYI